MIKAQRQNGALPNKLTEMVIPSQAAKLSFIRTNRPRRISRGPFNKTKHIIHSQRNTELARQAAPRLQHRRHLLNNHLSHLQLSHKHPIQAPIPQSSIPPARGTQASSTPGSTTPSFVTQASFTRGSSTQLSTPGGSPFTEATPAPSRNAVMGIVVPLRLDVTRESGVASLGACMLRT